MMSRFDEAAIGSSMVCMALPASMCTCCNPLHFYHNVRAVLDTLHGATIRAGCVARLAVSVAHPAVWAIRAVCERSGPMFQNDLNLPWDNFP